MAIFEFYRRKRKVKDPVPEGHQSHEFGALFFNIDKGGLLPITEWSVTPYSRLDPRKMMSAWATARQQLLPIADDDIFPISQSDVRPVRIYLGFVEGLPDDALTLRIEPDEVSMQMASNIIHLGYHVLEGQFGSFRTCLNEMLRKGGLTP